ncbi:MAG: DUF4160 domain-containing protein [Gemmatimonadetes bacterium]|nr:DUF4160 domain-containing protein [Gemmatimonadota bacterium]MBA4158179.1 DUF4160 domain-containing protein [Gemmatimonadota bacterium]
MPIISRFYGIVIRIFYDDHAPPHFHASYAEHELIVGIAPIAILNGEAPSRVRSMVLEWSALHQAELLTNWECCHTGVVPSAIAPLE